MNNSYKFKSNQKSSQQGDLVVFTTAEVVIGECQNAIFGRWSNFVIFIVLPFLDFSWTLVPIRTKSRNRDLRREALFLIFSCSGQNSAVSIFTREHDSATGFDELKVEARRS